jgi:hypothetical protein
VYGRCCAGRGAEAVSHGAALSVAAERPGTNSNLLADELLIDGNAVLNGIPVELAPVRAAETVPG